MSNVGYVQGMSDLLSVVYAIMQDDSDAFWCFCGFMDRMVPRPRWKVLTVEIQLFNESNWDEKTTCHFETINSTHDSKIIYSPRKFRVRRILLFIQTTPSLV